MPPTSEIGKTLLIAGLAIAGIGLVLWLGVGKTWLGRLPGDIHVRKGNVQVYFPIVTCIVLSLLLTLLSWIFRGRR